MNHIVTVGIDINENHIREMIEKQVRDDVTSALENGFVKKSYYGKVEVDSGIRSVIENCADKICQENKQEILEIVANKLVRKIQSSKDFKGMKEV